MVKEISSFRPQANQDCFTSSQNMERLTNMLQRETLICFQIFPSIFLPFTFSQKQGLRLGTAREAFSFGVKLYGSKVVQDPFRTFLCHLESKISQPEASFLPFTAWESCCDFVFLHCCNFFSNGIKINLPVEVWVDFLLQENHNHHTSVWLEHFKQPSHSPENTSGVIKSKCLPGSSLVTVFPPQKGNKKNSKIQEYLSKSCLNVLIFHLNKGDITALFSTACTHICNPTKISETFLANETPSMVPKDFAFFFKKTSSILTAHY